MKTVEGKKIVEKKINWALPDQTVTKEAFINSIREAEKGPFYTAEESMQHFEEWLSSRKNK